jgi:hypothetical protein
LKLAFNCQGNEIKTPNKGIKWVKSDKTIQSVAGYKGSQKVTIFGKVIEKGQTYRVAILEF